ncbi:DNA repair protein RecN [Radiobacillus sp. PE A8.2]|uniref:DNA repair protein RecN n=1 Tax=Radiobacillus sp. PE A8.2 TaxID=3380349 RepID=UPI00388FCF80
MLTELSIKDFAIIDSITITFSDGLTVLTGETGAGKSIIIDAVQLLAGGRGSVEFVRHGSDKADIEGLFIIPNIKHPIYRTASDYGIEIGTDGMIILNRIITSNGKSICRINGKLVTLAILKEFGKTLIDIHSQNETQSLMDVDRHIELLDLYKQNELNSVMTDYTEIYTKMKNLKKRYQKLSENEQEMAQRLDLLEFQLKEIEEANLQPDEDEQLTEKRRKLLNFEKIYQGVNQAYDALYGEQKGLDWLSLAMQGLEDAGEHDQEIAGKKEEITNHYYMVEELTFYLRNHLDSLEFDPDHLNTIESRLNEINRLKKKYGQTVNDMLEYASKIEEEIDEIKNKDSHLLNMQEELAEIGEDALVEAKHIHDLRKEAAKSLKHAIQLELKDLYLEKASFDVDFSMKKGKDGDPEINGVPIQLQTNGFDTLKFMISTNPGEPLKEIHKVASGGELSRIMLALKKVFASHQGVTSVIFDEVDTGVSGRVAQSIAEKIYGISNGSQVLCITHLPQVASMADTHLQIEKHTTNDRTTTSVKGLPKEERVEEISRMMTGTEITFTSMEHARELILLADRFKSNLIMK